MYETVEFDKIIIIIINQLVACSSVLAFASAAKRVLTVLYSLDKCHVKATSVCRAMPIPN